MGKLTLEGVAVSAAVGGIDLGAEYADTKGFALGPLSASDLTRTTITLGAAGLNYYEKNPAGDLSRYSEVAFYSSLPLFEKTLANAALKAMGRARVFGKPGTRSVTVRAASSGLTQYQNPAISGNYRSITA